MDSYEDEDLSSEELEEEKELLKYTSLGNSKRHKIGMGALNVATSQFKERARTQN
jgi:hypothetical protein